MADVVREKALAAAEEEDRLKQATQESAVAARQRAQADAAAEVLRLVASSDLVRWFPGAEWEVYEVAVGHYGSFGEFGMVGVVCTGRPSGSDPCYAGVPVFGVGEEDRGSGREGPRLWLVDSRYEKDGAHSYWAGPPVKSLPQLGRAIKALDDVRRQKLLEDAASACRCFQRGTSPCTRGLRCAQSGEHCARVNAAAVARCQMDVDAAMRRWRGTRRGQSASMMEAIAPGADELPVELTPKSCPETGGECQYRETCDGASTITCWARRARVAGEPEGRTTGLHRDSMG